MQQAAREIMSQPVMTVRPETSCQEAAQLFNINHISGAPVVDARGVLVGVISITDLLQFKLESGMPLSDDEALYDQQPINDWIGEHGYHIETLTGLVADKMRHHVLTAYPDTLIKELAYTMAQHQVHRIIILKRDQQIPVGIVSSFDLLKVFAEMPSVPASQESHPEKSAQKNTTTQSQKSK